MKNTFFIRNILLVLICLHSYLFCTAQNCVDYKLISGYTTIVGARSGEVEPLPGGTYLFNTKTYNGNIITKVNALGDTLWSNNYKPLLFYDSYSPASCAVLDQNKRFVAAFGDDVILMVDTGNGQVISSKKLKIPVVSSAYILDIAIASNNDKIVLLADESTYRDEGYIFLRLSPDLSTIKWTKHIAAYDLYLHKIEIAGEQILAGGSKNSKGFMLVLDASNGTIRLQQQLDINAATTPLYINQFKAYQSGYVMAVSNYNNSNISKAIIRLNQNFQITNAYYLNPFRYDIDLLLLVDPNGALAGAGSGSISMTYFFKISATDSILFLNNSLITSYSALTDIKKTGNGFTLLSSLTYTSVGIGNFGSIALSNCDANGNIPNCPGTLSPLAKSACSTILTTTNLVAKDTSFLSVLQEPVSISNNTFTLSTRCIAENRCDVLDTEGPQQLCGIPEAVYTAKRNKGCSNPVNWTSKNSNMVVDALSDSSVLVRFLQTGNYTLYSSLINGCDTIVDSLRIAFTNAGNSNKPDLGPDRELCPQNSVLLNAKQGYNSYQWQNGSGDSTFLVTQPGRYYVTVTDACLRTFSDTVLVTAAPPVTVNIGPNRSKCNNDTLQLVAPAGFISYTWGPDYNLSAATTQSVIVNPTKDTFYFLKAEKTPGCFGFDTVLVKVNTSPPVRLGADLRFCQGDSALLQAGPGFADYSWNNGARSPQLLVKTQGTYVVKATTAEGCSSTDTLQVLPPYTLPVVQLNKDSLLCSQSARVLDAGSFSSYSWNTGQTTQSITVNSTGLYAVTVTDINGCKANDTTRLTKLLPLPAGFLGADTSICNYGTLNLAAPPGYRRYLWNNGATTTGISIQNPGLYTLQVTDVNNCSGTDSVNVALQQCLTGFYIPNAFTPNNDGLNDEFKPMLFGNVLQYSFSIYNRMGELVFTTGNLQSGWNGSVKGWPQDPGLFAWKCQYQLAGEQPQQRKGTVVLVR